MATLRRMKNLKGVKAKGAHVVASGYWVHHGWWGYWKNSLQEPC